MAYRPSFRRSVKDEEVEPNLTPIMNLMVVLIPLLLSSAQFIKIGVIDLNLPPAVGAKGGVADAPKEAETKLDLAVTITDQGFFISSSFAVLQGEKQGDENTGPSIPKKEDGEYDYDELSRQLLELKRKAINRFPDTEKIVIQAEPEIQYQILVGTMDAARNISVDDKMFTLFPDVSLSAGII
ncbi:biopolymer transporter ExbD [candidate division KSB1 bacterium]|nr:biopolymer transporter ExbD [candidate division KSB1 bacterium]